MRASIQVIGSLAIFAVAAVLVLLCARNGGGWQTSLSSDDSPARSARKWAAEVFASRDDAFASRPSNDVITSHRVKQTPTFSDVSSERASRSTPQLSEHTRRSRRSSRHPHPPSVDAGHEFFSFALSELGQAPNINKLRRSFHASKAQPVVMKAENEDGNPRMSQLSAVYDSRKRLSHKYSLAPESRESGGEKAYDFARSLAQAKTVEANKGIKLSNHHPNEQRTMGISSREAQDDISNYFNKLVSSAREAKHHPASHRYFETKDARKESLAQVPSNEMIVMEMMILMLLMVMIMMTTIVMR
ncbi:hypothetical protein GUITHDRAFT_115448 [Guillardia theta CCMP2712]|uniref:Uncharacterized protein n=1 Tax=Guillardia theta (strain CCMP2712) TaxID=905079 RepID=L1IRN1_GUITC|nr:hypothetical protein GUITHDRAFT_115448 [Guillardia theta CCMP2712]EKX38485.1 hypothetical protein GUITHDRAFT_115448 [Guillardia theta CCMP2712]|eukprot:XP_005825465.1 hypothetical protein GUITHDRAFT_115448 [Guillardia theta CCMP2712]